MGRNTRHYQKCWFQGDVETKSLVSSNVWVEHVALCGRKRLSKERDFAATDDKITCPGCSAKYWKAKVADVTLGESLAGQYGSRHFRSLAPVLFKGKKVGYLGMQNGWGQSWQLYHFTFSGTDRCPDYEAKSFKSREAALARVPSLVEQDWMWPEDEVKDRAQRIFERRAKEKAAAEAEEARRQAERDARLAAMEQRRQVVKRLLSRSQLGPTVLSQEEIEAIAHHACIRLEDVEFIKREEVE